MALPPSRTTIIGTTEHAHEQEGIDFLRRALPDRDPFHMWALFELVQRSSGRRYECDVLVLGYNALYLVELKGYSGHIEGDSVDWHWTPPHGRRHAIAPPIGLNNQKAKVLKSELERHWVGDRRQVPWVESLVFLSSADLTLSLKGGGELGVVTRKDVERALTHHEFRGARESSARIVNRPTAEAVRKALEKMGLRPRETRRHAGSFKLTELLRSEDGAPYQDWLAEHRDLGPQRRALARSYNVPAQTDAEKRERLFRAAKREADAYMAAGGAQSILTFVDFDGSAEVGPTLLLEHFEGGEPLDRFLRHEPPSFEDRCTLVEEIAHALSYAHQQEVIHGGLSPDAVLVRRGEGDRLEIRLCDFQLGSGRDATATSHYTSLAATKDLLYLAPERLVGQDPTPETDVYGLGALAHLLFTEKPPGATLKEVDERIRRDECLDVDVVSDTVPAGLRDLIRRATHASPDYRHGSVEEFVDELLEVLTAPSPAEPKDAAVTYVDPLEAQPDDRLNDHLVWQGHLGEGASARVFKVLDTRSEASFALKVSLNADHDERLQEEGATLENLEHPHIARCRQIYQLGGRTALLLELAGDETLAQHLRKEGAVSLDFAKRYGDELLSALVYLESPTVDVVHKDIKPANIGVGSTDKTKKRLTLFDFSLAGTARTHIEVGTRAYRDPALGVRGAWDAAADRWSAAVTLYEMLTGARPHLGRAGAGYEALIERERFDPVAREALASFFERALAAAHEARFASAEQMREAWRAAFEASDHPSVHPSAPGEVALEQLEPATPLAQTGRLSARALNALDRAGILTVGELAAAPENRIRLMRGVGRLVAFEITKFRAELAAKAPQPEPSFRPDYAGDRRQLEALELDESLLRALLDAGLRTTTDAAQASNASLEHVLGPGIGALGEALDRLHRGAQELRTDRLGAHAKSLLESRRKGMAYVRALFGVDAPFEGRDDVRVGEVAEHFGVTTANVYIALGKERERWDESDEAVDLALLLREALKAPATVRALAAELAARLEGDVDAQLHLAMGLVRVALEYEKTEDDGLRATRLGEDRLWVVSGERGVEPLRKLAEAGHALASRDTLPSSVEVQEAIRVAVAGSHLEQLPPTTLLRLLAETSAEGAVSARGELYPKDMPPERTLRLCAPVLRSGQSAQEITQLVRARYPEAAPLPPRPELDRLLDEVRGLRFNEARGTFEAPGEAVGPARSTRFSTETQSSHHLAALSPRARPRVSPREAMARDFEENLAVAKERGGVRVLRTTLDRAPEDARRLARHLGVSAPIYVDRALVRAMRELAGERRIKLDVVHAADAEGPSSPAWGNLVKLMQASAARVAEELAAEPGPKVLTHLGPIARYGLDGLVERLIREARAGDRLGLFFVVPGADGESSPALTPSYTLPGVMQGEVQPIPKHWKAEL